MNYNEGCLMCLCPKKKILFFRFIKFARLNISMIIIHCFFCLIYFFLTNKAHSNNKFFFSKPQLSWHMHLKKSTIFKIILNYDVSYSIENKLNVGCISCACEMRVNFFLIFSFVEILKFHSDVT
jgi:hypothetical protein